MKLLRELLSSSSDISLSDSPPLFGATVTSPLLLLEEVFFFEEAPSDLPLFLVDSPEAAPNPFQAARGNRFGLGPESLFSAVRSFHLEIHTGSHHPSPQAEVPSLAATLTPSEAENPAGVESGVSGGSLSVSITGGGCGRLAVASLAATEASLAVEETARVATTWMGRRTGKHSRLISGSRWRMGLSVGSCGRLWEQNRWRPLPLI